MSKRSMLVDAGWAPGMILSLWDIMEIFPAAVFLHIISLIDRDYGFLSKGVGVFSFFWKRKLKNAFHTDPMYASIERYCESLELMASLATIRKMRTSWKNGKYNEFFALGKEFSDRFKDEMGCRLVFTLSLKEGNQFRSPRDGWEQIICRFPDCVTDVEEANKCYAFGRYAAAVFHSLHIVEIGLIELGRVIVATDHQTGWNATTNRLSQILKTAYPNMTPFQQHHRRFLEQMDTLIKSMKSSWRNKVSHAQDRLVLMGTDFTPEVAEEILIASRSFMRRLATEAPTNPDPDA